MTTSVDDEDDEVDGDNDGRTVMTVLVGGGEWRAAAKTRTTRTMTRCRWGGDDGDNVEGGGGDDGGGRRRWREWRAAARTTR